MESEGCILVVEDSREVREFLVMLLAGEGRAMLAARSGAEALARLRHHWPRLILLNYGLGDMTAADVAAAYHRLPPPHAPIVLTTGGPDAARLAAEIGAADWLVKPFDLDDLAALVARYAP